MRLETETTVFKKDSVKDAIKNKVVHGANPTGDFQVGDTWFNPNEGYKMYSWNGTGWSPEQLDTDAIKAGAIKAGNIDAGAVTADKIGAHSVTVDKLVVGDMSNLATVNENDPNSMVTTPISLATSWAVINQTTGLRGIIKADASQTQMALSQHQIPNFFAAGDELYYSFRVRAVTTARSIGIRIAAYDANKTLLGSVGKTISITTTVALYTGTISIADGSTWAWANAVYYTLYISDTNGSGDQLRIINAVVRKKSTGDMLIDGTITADKLSADAIDGKTITGATIRTPAGKGWKLTHIDYVDTPSSPYNSIGKDANYETYNAIEQEGFETLDANGALKSLMSSVRMDLYRDNTFLKSVFGWYLADAVYSPTIYTDNGEVATTGANVSSNKIALKPIDIDNLPSGLSQWTTLGGSWYYKVGTRVHVHVAVSGLTADTNVSIGTLLAGFRPYNTIVAAGRGSTGSDFASMWVASNGTVTIRSTTASAAVDVEYDAFN